MDLNRLECLEQTSELASARVGRSVILKLRGPKTRGLEGRLKLRGVGRFSALICYPLAYRTLLSQVSNGSDHRITNALQMPPDESRLKSLRQVMALKREVDDISGRLARIARRLRREEEARQSWLEMERAITQRLQQQQPAIPQEQQGPIPAVTLPRGGGLGDVVLKF
ncbi:hypothetical protein BV22DRAFT_1132834 [Leucogyrophana mollusca]|uniref:Uncharacterized protein n=1 Tax=Leucogyrophana mollusca TaxID=85980 RepID=A0ACB8B768_9AGAM|nr:hypothetical protein BV22DRAFT_1132834 [Leucogyrophana mollusca]